MFDILLYKVIETYGDDQLTPSEEDTSAIQKLSTRRFKCQIRTTSKLEWYLML